MERAAVAPSRSSVPRSVRAWLLLLPTLLLLLPCYVGPLLQLLGTSVGGDHGPTAAFYLQALTDRPSLLILWRTIVLSVEVTVLAVLIGYPLAYMIARAPERSQHLLLLLVAIPLWTSSLVRSFVWIVLLGREGVLNQLALSTGLLKMPVQMLYGRPAVLIGLVHIMIPHVVFPLVSVMRRISPRRSEVAKSLGAGPMSAFWLIFFPQSLSGLASGAVLVFVLCCGFFVTPALLGGLRDQTYVMLIQQQVDRQWALAAAMSVVLLAVTLVFVALLGRFLRVDDDAGSTRLPKPGRLIGAACAFLGRFESLGARRPARPARPARWPVAIAGWGAILFLLVPILLLFPLSLTNSPYLRFPPPGLSLRWYANFFSRSDWTSAAVISFQVGGAVTLLATAVGTCAAVALSRIESRWSRMLYGFLISPMIVPTLIIAVAFYFQFAAFHLIGSLPGLVLAHSVIALPVVVVVVTGGLKRASLGPERAALSLGAGPLRAFFATTFVAVRPSVLTGALFAFLVSFDDVVIALFLAGINSTLPKRMWDSVQLEIDPTVAAVSAMLILLSIAVVVAWELIRLRLHGGEEAGSLVSGP